MDFFDWYSLGALLVFLCAFIGRTAVLGARGVRVFVIGAGKKGFSLIREAAAVVLLLIFWALIAFQSLRVPWMPPALSRAFFGALRGVRISGAALMAAGLGMFIAALAAFGASWRIGIDTRKPGALMTGGVFSITRNPVFLGMDLMFLGTFLVHPTWPFLAVGAVFIIGVHLHILEEERFLSRLYGDAYRDYRARVPRYIA